MWVTSPSERRSIVISPARSRQTKVVPPTANSSKGGCPWQQKPQVIIGKINGHHLVESEPVAAGSLFDERRCR